MPWRAVCVLAATACTSLAGLDGDYVLGTGGGAGSAAGPSSASGATSTSSTTAAGGSAGHAGGSGGSAVCVEGDVHVATVADCVATVNPDPDACAAVLAPGVMVVDVDKDTLDNAEARAYVRFDLGVVPRELMSLELQLVVGDASDAGSVSSGEVWRVVPFVRDDLYSQIPTTVGQTALAGDQGAVSQTDTVRWSLPPDALDAQGSLFVELRTQVGDGVQYHKLDGPVPPRVVVHCP